MVRIVFVKCRGCGTSFPVKDEKNIDNELYCSGRCKSLASANMEGMEQ